MIGADRVAGGRLPRQMRGLSRVGAGADGIGAGRMGQGWGLLGSSC